MKKFLSILMTLSYSFLSAQDHSMHNRLIESPNSKIDRSNEPIMQSMQRMDQRQEPMMDHLQMQGVQHQNMQGMNQDSSMMHQHQVQQMEHPRDERCKNIKRAKDSLKGY